MRDADQGDADERGDEEADDHAADAHHDLGAGGADHDLVDVVEAAAHERAR